MGGLGIGEALLIGLIVGFIGIVLLTGLFGIRGLRPGSGGGSDAELQERILDEIESLRLRVGALEDRLTRSGTEESGTGRAEGEGGSKGRAGEEGIHE